MPTVNVAIKTKTQLTTKVWKDLVKVSAGTRYEKVLGELRVAEGDNDYIFIYSPHLEIELDSDVALSYDLLTVSANKLKLFMHDLQEQMKENSFHLQVYVDGVSY